MYETTGLSRARQRQLCIKWELIPEHPTAPSQPLPAPTPPLPPGRRCIATIRLCNLSRCPISCARSQPAGDQTTTTDRTGRAARGTKGYSRDLGLDHVRPIYRRGGRELDYNWMGEWMQKSDKRKREKEKERKNTREVKRRKPTSQSHCCASHNSPNDCSPRLRATDHRRPWGSRWYRGGNHQLERKHRCHPRPALDLTWLYHHSTRIKTMGAPQ